MLKAFSKDLLKYLPSQFVPTLAGFITAPILTRLFLPAEYGNYALAEGIAGFLLALAVSGFSSSAIRFFPAYKVKSELGVFFATLNSVLAIGIAAVSAVSFCGLLLLKGHLPPELYRLLFISILIFVVQSVFGPYTVVVRAQKRSGTYSVILLFVKYGSLGLGLLLVIVFGFRFEGLMWGEVIVTALSLPFLIYLTMKGATVLTQDFRSQDTIQFWRYAWPLSLGNMAMWGLRISDRYVLSFFRLASEVGFYSVAYNLASKSIDMLVSLFLLSMGPIVMNTWENQGRDATEKTVTMITRLYLIICLPAAVGLSVLAFPFIALLTGTAYHEGYRIVGYVAFSSFGYGLSQIASLGILIAKETRQIAIYQLIAAAVNLGLNLILVPRYGFVAAGFTTLLGYTVLFGLQAYGSRSYLTWCFPFKTLRNVSIATVFMGFTAWAIYASFANRDHVNVGYLFLSIAVAALVYLGSILLLGEMTREETAAAKHFLQKKQAIAL